MRILITNDDGYSAEGIRALALWAKKLGEVTVIAPKVEQSGKSHAIDFTRPIEIKEVDEIPGVRTVYVDSTPADCVRYAILGEGEKYDLVLSGINRGVNMGVDLVYSGTCGAIFEAGRLGHKGIAFSAYYDTNFEAEAKELDTIWSFIEKNNLLAENDLYNINIPKASKGIKVTKQGSAYFSDEFVRVDGDIFEQRGHKIEDVCPEDMSRDTVATEAGYITITPLMTTRTNMSVFEKLKNL
jgi:5'-nucleotidase